VRPEIAGVIGAIVKREIGACDDGRPRAPSDLPRAIDPRHESMKTARRSMGHPGAPFV
jgi:hypothetical protein